MAGTRIPQCSRCSSCRRARSAAAMQAPVAQGHPQRQCLVHHPQNLEIESSAPPSPWRATLPTPLARPWLGLLRASSQCEAQQATRNTAHVSNDHHSTESIACRCPIYVRRAPYRCAHRRIAGRLHEGTIARGLQIAELAIVCISSYHVQLLRHSFASAR